MNIFDSVFAIRLIFILGIVNLVTALLIFFSCRCLSGSKIGSKLMKYPPYQRFYRYHLSLESIVTLCNCTRSPCYNIMGWPAQATS